MGLSDIFKKKSKEKEINTSGWDAIAEACLKVYPNQKEHKHYGTLIKWKFGGNDPLDGIDVYETDDYWHFVTYGLSELYEKECDNKEYSGYGMEFTFKLKKDNYEDTEAEIRCVCGLLQQIARYSFVDGEIFRPNEYLYTGQKEGIDSKNKSNITGFITILDNDLKEINTPNGKVAFVELIGATDKELLAIYNKEIKVLELYEKLGSDVTNYHRDSVI